nr:malto-oligosyltrehalose trehalohydrolase [Microlunatus speluncae]
MWAPRPDRVRLWRAGEVVELVRAGEDHRVCPSTGSGNGTSGDGSGNGTGGWWVPPAGVTVDHDVDYGFLIDDDETVLPDPRSRRQPAGVHRASRGYDPGRYSWQDHDWTGRQLAGAVIYELHVGTFTPDGTLVSAIDRLDHLVELGIDLVELMPVNAFNGSHNWGYDGVLWSAVQEEYGGPEAYQGFVDACHQRGLGVIQDVVYNHLGPSGNYLPRFGPYLDQSRSNTWGESINLDGPDSDEVRRFIIDSALMWLRDYHVDGLRLDAVHALRDTRATHVLQELAIEVDALSAYVGRPLSLIAESDLNDPRLITAREAGGYGLDGQWSDDFHHALYANLTGDSTGYYADFDSVSALAKVLTRGFFHDGTPSTFRGRAHGRPFDTHRTPAWRLVVCSDNHDQIGNRADGSRLSGRLDQRQLELMAMITVLAPFTPMIFMGEEWGARTPWQFFTSHPEPELAEAVAKGRVAEFAAMGWDLSVVPDPQDPETFRRSKLDWAEPDQPDRAALLRRYRELIMLRRSRPEFTDPRLDRVQAEADDERGLLQLRRDRLLLVINFSEHEAEVATGPTGAPLITVGAATPADGTVRLGGHSATIMELT